MYSHFKRLTFSCLLSTLTLYNISCINIVNQYFFHSRIRDFTQLQPNPLNRGDSFDLRSRVGSQLRLPPRRGQGRRRLQGQGLHHERGTGRRESRLVLNYDSWLSQRVANYVVQALVIALSLQYQQLIFQFHCRLQQQILCLLPKVVFEQIGRIRGEQSRLLYWFSGILSGLGADYVSLFSK